MLFALRHPPAFLALLAGFLLAVLVHGMVQAGVAALLGDRAALAAGLGRPDLRRHVDPFGAVAAAIAGVGWGAPVPLDARRLGGHAFRGAGARKLRYAVAVLCGPLAVLLLAGLLLVGYRLAGGSELLARAVTIPDLLHGDTVGLDAGQEALLLLGVANLAVGLLALVPLPPLDGGRLLFALAPRSTAWQRAEYYLVEQNVGIGALLVLLLLPLGGEAPLLLVLIDLVGRHLIQLVLLGT